VGHLLPAGALLYVQYTTIRRGFQADFSAGLIIEKEKFEIGTLANESECDIVYRIAEIRISIAEK